MTYNLVYHIYYISLVFACLCSLCRYKRLDIASKVICVLVCCALLNESAAYYVAIKYHNNLPVYAIYCFIEFGLLCLYFNFLIDVFTKKKIGIYIGVAGIIFGVVNVTFVQNLNSINSYFLFFEGLSVIALSLFAFFRLLLKHDSLNLYRYHHFWFISILIFFWSITFLTWGLYDYINLELQHEAWKINVGLMIAGTITYGCFGFVFILYPKIPRTNE
jgi:hypothetical protein